MSTTFYIRPNHLYSNYWNDVIDSCDSIMNSLVLEFAFEFGLVPVAHSGLLLCVSMEAMNVKMT